MIDTVFPDEVKVGDVILVPWDVPREVKHVFRPDWREGTINILQPNYRYAFREYFDDYTHIAVYSHISLADFLTANGFDVIDVQPRFLPLTVKSRLPVFPPLIAAYLMSPVKPMGKQMLVRARVR